MRRRRRGLRRLRSSRSTRRPPSCRPGGSARPSGWRSTSRSPTRPPCPTRCHAELRLRRGLMAPGRRAAAGPPAATRRDDVRRAQRPAAVRRGVRAAGGPGPAPRRRHGRCRPPRGCRATDGLLAAFDARLPFTLTARAAGGRRAAIVRGPRPRAPDAPAAAGRGRLRQDRRGAAGDARRGRRRRPGRAARARPRCSRSSTTGRSPRCSGRSPSAGCSAAPTSAPGSRCSPARRAPPPGAPTCSTIVSGDAGIVVGTHALIQDTVDFHDLGLVVVDEQHRFGVEQRDALRAKAKVPPARARHDRDARSRAPWR